LWVLPGVFPALLADSLLYGHVRYVVSKTEQGARSATDAVQQLAKRSPTSAFAAGLLGGGGIVAMLAVVVPSLYDAYVDLEIRSRVEQAINSVRGLEDEIEIGWFTTRLLPRQTEHPSCSPIRAQRSSTTFTCIRKPAGSSWHLVPTSRRWRGKTILIAPTRDADDRWKWMCIPVDIPKRWLPKDCR
jgi:hypothetical protein